jgi:putative ABC transport system permease protein
MSRNSRVSVNGVSASWLGIRDFDVEQGRAFTETETEALHRVAIIGPKTASDLLGTEDPLDKTLKIGGINFTVIGVTKAKGDAGFFNPDDMVVIPYTTAMKQLFGVDYLREIDVQAEDGSDLIKVQEEITTLLRKRHRIQAGLPEDFSVRNQADMVQFATDTNRNITMLLGGIASISLLVGGIGIMNIMLVTVTERTREIGVRKAIGARQRNILTQFLLEAVIVSGLGGLIGAAAGVGASAMLGKFMPFEGVVEVFSIFLSLGFSVGVGVFFGFYPAWRAAKLDPVEALRYE